ncbi:MAG: hypothetical protein ABDH28_05975 [Brevinematia bacterium]
MRRIFVWLYTGVILLAFGVITYLIGEYLYLRITFEAIDREVKNYQDIPYMNRKLSVLENEYNRIRSLEEETKSPGLILSRILSVFSKYNVRVNYVIKESSEDLGEIYKASVGGNFRNIFLSLGEIENLLLPMKFSKILISGESENVNMVLHFTIVE